ncbi:phosphotransferase [Leucobacter komagatae]|uniref:2'-phosphotransferase n=1 Tax=Leucobacter komagatae TaxID=55969 RepID=A0A0D0IQA4_9MICO|nr:phosphotransferase [Leucobacter komagatae]KIP53774.1 2'-phosphotransferase [Leucobacter komagatae]
MATLTLTLAALATSAVPGLVAVAVRPHHASGDEYATAILTTPDDEIIVSVPRTQQAEITQSASALGMAALTDGARAELPFEAPRSLGMTRAGDTRAVATTFLQGARFEASELQPDAILIDSIAESLAAIHALPRAVAQQGGLLERTARDQRLLVTRLVDRAQASRYLPETVHARWTEVLESAELWDFEPRIVHGTMTAEALLVDDDRVVGVLDWSGLSIGDPASDVAWLFEAGDDVFDAVMSRYARRSGTGESASLRSRAAFYHELEIAKWLLHGVDTHDTEVIDDAVGMLDRMVDRLSLLAVPVPSRDPIGEEAAMEMLGQTPDIADRLSETAAFEALDEDRMFGFDTDFIEPLPEEEPDQAAGADAPAATPDTAGAAPGATADAQLTEPIEDLLTEPIHDEDLPGGSAR